MKPIILFILHLPPPVHGAAMVGKYIHDSRIVNEAFDCHYINLTTAKDLADIGKVGIRKLWQFAGLLNRIRKTVRKLKPSLVYVTPNACGGPFYKDFIVVQMLKMMRCRVVLHYHNKGVSTRQDRFMDNMLYKQFFKKVKVILLAEALYQDVKKYVNRNDVYICPNGIPETQTQEPKAERHNKIPHLLFLSNLLESKGVLVLLDACKILKEKGYSFVCDFVGGETSEIDATRFAKEVESRELKGQAVYQGKKYGDEKQPFFLSADVFILPTFYHNECFPLVLLEAMEQGVACIASNEGGIADIIEEEKNGFIIEKRNALQLAERMEILINNPELCREMGMAGRKRFLYDFTIHKFEQRITEILLELSEMK